MLRINYRAADLRAELRWESADEFQPWIGVVRRLALDQSEDARQEDAFRISLPWWSFVALRSALFEVVTAYSLVANKDVLIGAEAASLLRQSTQTVASYTEARSAVPIQQEALQNQLKALGFGRALSAEQMRNVAKLSSLPAGATFSVPGAGKTTEALAYFALKAQEDDRLLVIAPKNAFAAWDEEVAECLPELKAEFVRLRGGRDGILKLLSTDPRFMIITYQQLARVPDVIAAHCAQHRIHVFLDESHRIKSGVAKQTARATLGLAHLPVSKLIMSGTPMPQSTEDLVPQLTFLYPELDANGDSVVDLIRPVYVRTNKKELGLPEVTRRLIQLRMAPMQAELYRLMKFEVARQATEALDNRSKQIFRSLGRSVARLIQFVSNPALLSSDISFAHAGLLAGVLSEGDGPKLKYVLKRARILAPTNKVLIWSSFVKNVEYMAARLSDLGAVYIHGGVDAGDENDDDTREGKIKLFHDDKNVRVLVANPAAASEGVSLHHVCHHAIYLDRTFNAAHYLQSEDRIHRFGLKPDEETNIEIVECVDSIDETVRNRLGYKISRMAEALEDTSLRPDPIPLDPTDIEDLEEYSTGLTADDIQAILKDIREQ